MSGAAWSFLRTFSTTLYYEAAQSGSLTGSGDHSFGAIFALESDVSAINTIFGNAVYGTSGSGIRVDATGKLEGACGTVEQLTGTTEAAADATYGLDPEGDLINAWRASQNTLTVAGTAGAEAGALNPRFMQLVYPVVTVDISGNQTFYVNGRIVAQATDGIVANANPFRIGVDAAGANPGTSVWLAGCWYENSVLSTPRIAAMYAAAQDAKDVVGPNYYSVGNDLAYIWSVKTGNFDGRDNWASRGRLTSINMVKQGATAISTNGVASNLVSVADLPWQTV